MIISKLKGAPLAIIFLALGGVLLLGSMLFTLAVSPDPADDILAFGIVRRLGFLCIGLGAFTATKWAMQKWSGIDWPYVRKMITGHSISAAIYIIGSNAIIAWIIIRLLTGGK